MKQKVTELVNGMLERQVIELSNSPWVSPSG